jgi:hypothetical protein
MKGIAGRKLLFKTPEELQSKIEAYFDYCDSRTKKEVVKTRDYYEVIDLPDPIPYTIYGLNYAERPEFSVFIARAKHKILTNKVVRGLDGKSNPAITKLLLGFNYGIIEPKGETQDDKNININIQYPPDTK